MFACIGTLNEINNFEILVFSIHINILKKQFGWKTWVTINCI